MAVTQTVWIVTYSEIVPDHDGPKDRLKHNLILSEGFDGKYFGHARKQALDWVSQLMYDGNIPDTLYNEHGGRISCTGPEGTFDDDEVDAENRTGYSYIDAELTDLRYWCRVVDGVHKIVQIVGTEIV